MTRQQQPDGSAPGKSGRITELERKHKETCVDLRAALNSGLAMQRLTAAFGPGNPQAEVRVFMQDTNPASVIPNLGVCNRARASS